MPSVLYYEHEISNLLDFTRKACLSEDEFSDFINKLTVRLQQAYDKNDVPYLMERVYKNSVYMDGEWWVSLYKIGFSESSANDIVRELYAKEICGGLVSLDVYLSKYERIWNLCLKELDQNKNHIFEGALLHNPLLDLIGHYMLSDDEILLFYKELFDVINPEYAKIEYILPDSVRNVIQKAAYERKASVPLWKDSLINWSENCSYGKKHALKGMEGAITLCEEMTRVQCLVCECLSLPVNIIRRK